MREQPWFDANVSVDEWETIRIRRPNVLVLGSRADTLRTVTALLPILRPPIARSAGGSLVLPSEAAGTLIVLDGESLHTRDQRRLYDWLSQVVSGTQVITTASADVFALVQQRLFLDELYYRLNVVSVPVTSRCWSEAPVAETVRAAGHP